MLGHKNDRIKFDSGSEWLNNINWKASISRVWMRRENDYEYMLKLGARDDIFRRGNQVFYTQLDLNLVHDDRGVNLNPSVEIGNRICLNKNACLTPFVCYEHFHDWYRLGKGEDIFSAGLRLEMGLGREASGSFLNSRKSEISGNEKATNDFPDYEEDQIPKFHIWGGYNTNIYGNKKSCRSSDLAVDVDLLKLGYNKTLALNTYAGIITEPGAFDIHNIDYKIGPSLKIDLADFDLRLFHTYRCLYGIEDEGLIKSYNIFGLEMSNEGQLSWIAQAGVYLSTHN